MSVPELSRGSLLTVEIEKLVAGGDGLARIDGLPIFVPRSVPGDRLQVEVVERKRSFARAEIVEIEREGRGRRAAPCRHFGRCGGCDLQQIEDEIQLELKAEATIETLRRLSRLELPTPTVIATDPWRYRRRTQLHHRRVDQRVEFGYHERRSHRIVAVEECPILVPELEIAVRRLPSEVEGRVPTRLDLAAGDDGTIAGSPVIAGVPTGELTTTAAGFDYDFDPSCFVQGHRQGTDSLLTAVVGSWKGDEAFDLFAGVGLFALPLSARYAKVVAVEGQREAVRYLRRNARRAKTAIEIVHQAVDSWIDALPDRCDRVIVDPPRVGISETVASRLLAARPRRLTYASCHPAALARDLARLAGGFDLESIVLVDMFPQTGHMEAVVQLTGNSSG